MIATAKMFASPPAQPMRLRRILTRGRIRSRSSYLLSVLEMVVSLSRTRNDVTREMLAVADAAAAEGDIFAADDLREMVRRIFDAPEPASALCRVCGHEGHLIGTAKYVLAGPGWERMGECEGCGATLQGTAGGAA